MADASEVPTVVFSEQFRGPPRSGNGGYVAGVLAGFLSPGPKQAVQVTLRAPAPLEQPLALECAGDTHRLVQGEKRIAEALLVPFEIAIPQPASWDQACAAREHAARSGSARNSHPVCFCCSTALPTNRGLHVQCYAVAGLGQVAGPWICDPSFAAADGRVPAELVWTALDCPGQMAWVAEGNRRVGLLGRMTARLVHPVDAGARTVIIGWTMGAEGRKFESGTALFDAQGTLCAYAKATWFGF
jgi:hypothetical protein